MASVDHRILRGPDEEVRTESFSVEYRLNAVMHPQARVATAPFNRSHSALRIPTLHYGFYCWRSVLYVIVVYSVMLITL